MRSDVLFLVGLLALTTTPSPAQSDSAAPPGIPDCGLSFIIAPLPLGRSPKNIEVGPGFFQYTYAVTLIDEFLVPVAGYPAALVTLTIGAPCANPVVIPASGPSDAFGVIGWAPASLDIPGGSCVGPAFVSIAGPAVPCVLPIPYVTSPDENGDGIISLPDLGLFAAAFAGGGPIEILDLNRDGVFGIADLGVFQRHFLAP